MPLCWTHFSDKAVKPAGRTGRNQDMSTWATGPGSQSRAAKPKRLSVAASQEKPIRALFSHHSRSPQQRQDSCAIYGPGPLRAWCVPMARFREGSTVPNPPEKSAKNSTPTITLGISLSQVKSSERRRLGRSTLLLPISEYRYFLSQADAMVSALWYRGTSAEDNHAQLGGRR